MNKNTQKVDIYQIVTDQIIEILENHKTSGYTQTWTPTTGEILASNPVSRHIYRGFNQFYLGYVSQKEGYRQNRWITIHQGNQLGARVKKGEKARPVTFWTRLFYDEKTRRNVTAKVLKIIQAGAEIPHGIKAVPVFKYYNVFNLEQFVDLPERLFFKGETLTFSEPEKDLAAEEFISGTGAKIKHVTDGGNCYYPALDFIKLCDRNQFTGKEAFYKTAFHELGHWTGHPTRLNRDLNHSFGTPEYAREEIIAELFSAYVAAGCGFSTQITNNAAYIESWLKVLRGDKKFIVQAASAAQKAADFAGDLVAAKIGQPVDVEARTEDEGVI